MMKNLWKVLVVTGLCFFAQTLCADDLYYLPNQGSSVSDYGSSLEDVSSYGWNSTSSTVWQSDNSKRNDVYQFIPFEVAHVSDLALEPIDKGYEYLDYQVGDTPNPGSSTGNVDTPLTGTFICFAFLLLVYGIVLILRIKFKPQQK